MGLVVVADARESREQRRSSKNGIFALDDPLVCPFGGAAAATGGSTIVAVGAAVTTTVEKPPCGDPKVGFEVGDK